MSRSGIPDFEEIKRQRILFNCYADKLVGQLPVLQIGDQEIQIISIMRDFELPKRIPFHDHPNFELTVNDRGRFENYVEDARSIFTPKEQYLSLCPVGILHSRKYCAPLTINTTFHFTISHPAGKDFSSALEKYLIRNGCRIPIDSGTRMLYELVFGRRNQLFRNNTAVECYLLSAFLYGLLAPVFQTVKSRIPAAQTRPVRSFTQDELVSEIKVLTVKYMNAKFIPGDLLQEFFHLSSNYLNRIFRRRTGISIRRYWEEQRLTQIRKLIEETDTPFNDIARTMAFRTPAQFSKYVRLHFGLSPSELRKKRSGRTGS
ncbi:MAG: AraC family transcriptional regulator [Lentisphaeria bacterium]|nr:AraC family transcriptional regulator [Lentisphaeria bacterium]